MKFNGKCKIRLLRDFPTINLRMGDSLTVYKYKYKSVPMKLHMFIQEHILDLPQKM